MSECRHNQHRIFDDDLEQQEGGIGRKICLLLLKGYKYCISPIFPPCCRYSPTCSQYAVDAVKRYGVLKGLWLAALRILRCHPFVKGGYDPVK